MHARLLALAGLVIRLLSARADESLYRRATLTLDSLGACQGVSVQDGRLYLYGDREVGVIRPYTLQQDTLAGAGPEIRLTRQGQDVINHPTGLARHPGMPVFMGNSIRLNAAGTAWKAMLYCLDWEGLLRTHTLDGNLLNTIDDDAAVQGTRPEYVTYRGKSLVATADYGNQRNEVRLYDPQRLRTARRTSEPGVVVARFSCSPWVQNLHWIPRSRQLVLVQNQAEGRRWRLTVLDFDRSVATGREQVLRVIDTDDADELEGFALLGNGPAALAVTSSRRQNVHLLDLHP